MRSAPWHFPAALLTRTDACSRSTLVWLAGRTWFRPQQQAFAWPELERALLDRATGARDRPAVAAGQEVDGRGGRGRAGHDQPFHRRGAGRARTVGLTERDELEPGKAVGPVPLDLEPGEWGEAELPQITGLARDDLELA